jgi:hypothetical protein
MAADHLGHLVNFHRVRPMPFKQGQLVALAVPLAQE